MTTAGNKQNSERGSESSDPRFLIIGRVRKPHGVRGELKVSVLTDTPERFSWLERAFLSRKELDPKAVELEVEKVRFAGGDALVKFKGYDSPETAGKFRQYWVQVALEDAVPLEEGEYYSYQLIGVRVVSDKGVEIGVLKEVMETGANDVFVIKCEVSESNPKGKDVLIPDIDEVVLEVDLEENVMVVKVLDGLLD